MMTKKINKKIYFIIIAFSFLYFFLFNVLSPIREEVLFPYDLSVFYVIGKGMKNGLLPYRDLFDHKGIYIYLPFYLASLISETNHIGLYIIFSLYFSLIGIYVYKILNICIATNIKYKKIILFISLFSFLFMFNTFTAFGSLEPEQINYPLVLICYYLFLRERKNFYEGIKLNEYRDIFITGLLAGIISLIKINHLILLLPIVASHIIIIIYDKKYLKLLKLFIFGISGTIISILPGILYLYNKGLLQEFYNDYIVFNLIYMKTKIILFKRYTGYTVSLIELLNAYKYIFLLTILSIITTYKYCKYCENSNNKKFKLSFNIEMFTFYILIILFSIIEIIMMKRLSGYYTSVLLFGALPFIIYLVNKFYKNKIAFDIVIVGLILVLSYFGSYEYIYQNSYIVTVKPNEGSADPLKTAYAKSKNILSKDDLSFLSIYHPRYYLHLDVLPKNKYFYRPIVERGRFKEYFETVEKETFDFKYDVILICYKGDTATYYSDEFFDFVKENYTSLYYNPYTAEDFLVRNNDSYEK